MVCHDRAFLVSPQDTEVSAQEAWNPDVTLGCWPGYRMVVGRSDRVGSPGSRWSSLRDQPWSNCWERAVSSFA